jgi:predicted transglutaminase-like cysteine proteinase
MLRTTMIILVTALALGSTVLSATAFGPPPPAPAPGVGSDFGGSNLRSGLAGRGGGFGGDHFGGHVGGVGQEGHTGVPHRVHPRFQTEASDLSAKWDDLRSRMRTEEEAIAACRADTASCPEPARHFLEIVELGRQREGRSRLGEINRAVNLRIKPANDWVQHGVDDFWSAPLATLGTGAGDCEDYAILKYAVLRELGVAVDDMRFLIVRDIRRSTNHAVLAVREDKQWLILDNRTLVLVKAGDVRHYSWLVVLDQRGIRRFEAVAFR